MPEAPSTDDPRDWHRYFAAVANNRAWALPCAETLRGYFHDRDSPDRELAFTHAIHAHADRVAGRDAEYRASYAAAEAAIAGIADAADREVVLQTFAQVPPP